MAISTISRKAMSSSWRFFDPCTIIFWTSAARGARDAKSGRPREDDFQALETSKRNTDEPSKKFSRGPNGRHNSSHIIGENMAPLNDHAARLVAPYESTLVHYTEAEIDRFEARLWRTKAKTNSVALQWKYRLQRLLPAYEKVWRLHAEKNFREPDHVVPRAVYLPAIVAVGFAECVFNLMAFEGLKAGDLETVLIAIGLGVATPLAAHCNGAALRQWTKDWPKWRTILMLVFSDAFLLPAMWAVSWLRQEFFREQAKALGVSLSAGTNGISQLALLSINGFVFVICVALAFFAHDSDRNLERICREEKRLWRRVKRSWKLWSKPAVRFNRVIAVLDKKKNLLQDNCLAAIAEYRDHNIRNREDSAPRWFRDALTQRVFRERDFGRLIEDQPRPLNEILQWIEPGDPVISESKAHRSPTT